MYVLLEWLGCCVGLDVGDVVMVKCTVFGGNAVWCGGGVLVVWWCLLCVFGVGGVVLMSCGSRVLFVGDV